MDVNNHDFKYTLKGKWNEFEKLFCLFTENTPQGPFK